MSANTSIEWTDRTWNPIRGCSRVSEGCRNCYAEKFAARFSGPGMPYDGLARMGDLGPRWTGKVELANNLFDPIRWRKPARVFVNSMSDLFHEKLEDISIDAVFGAMLASHTLVDRARHTFQILTKRAERMRRYFEAGPHALLKRWAEAFDPYITMDDPDTFFSEYSRDDVPWPLPNVWLGVSVENQAAADERIPLLLQTPAAVRFLSIEPLLGPVNLDSILGGTQWIGGQRGCGGQHHGIGTPECPRELHHHHDHRCRRGIDWVIVGGESGPNARPMHPSWVRSLRDQCHAAGVPFFFKQWGAWAPYDRGANDSRTLATPGSLDEPMQRFGKKISGRELDGRTWDEFPEALRA